MPPIQLFRSKKPCVAALVLSLTLTTAPPASAQLGPAGTLFWNEGSPGLESSLHADARFGAALAAGDFDCDGFADLAVGVPEAEATDGSGLLNVGYVTVLYGTFAGPSGSFSQRWEQHELAAQLEEAEDLFGEVLATGDFDGDGCDDLAIGSPHEDIGTETDAGGLQVVYGSPAGLSSAGNVYFRQGMSGVQGAAETLDYFGSALAAGDFDDDGRDDLAISAPWENVNGSIDGGVIHVLYGSASGLTGDDDLLLYRGQILPGSPIHNERLGFSLAAGQFGGLGNGIDLAIGAPFSDDGAALEAGRVIVVRDVGSDVFAIGEYTQSSSGVPGVSENGDGFGRSLAAGDFDGNGFDELAVGVTGEGIEDASAEQAGAVIVLAVIGGAHRLILQSDFPFEEPSDQDGFGAALASGDFDADGVDDLAIGVPREDLGPVVDAGIVHVVQGALFTGIDLGSASNWLQTLDPAEDGDEFGRAVVAAKLAGHSGNDLAIGAPGETITGHVDAGGVNIVLSEALFRDGFESGDTSRW